MAIATYWPIHKMGAMEYYIFIYIYKYKAENNLCYVVYCKFLGKTKCVYLFLCLNKTNNLKLSFFFV